MKAFEGCQRLIITEREKNEPITIEALKTVFKKFGGEKASLLDLRFLLVCIFGFAGFFRIDELLNVKISDLHIKEDHLKIILEKSKTDQHRDGHEVYIAQTETEICPVKISKEIH